MAGQRIWWSEPTFRSEIRQIRTRVPFSGDESATAAVYRVVHGEAQFLGRVEDRRRRVPRRTRLGAAQRTLWIERAVGVVGEALLALVDAVRVRVLLADQPVSDHLAFSLDLDLTASFQNVAVQTLQQFFARRRTVNLQCCQHQQINNSRRIDFSLS